VHRASVLLQRCYLLTRIGQTSPILILRSLLRGGSFFRALKRVESDSHSLPSRRSRRAAFSGAMTAANGGLGMLGSFIAMPFVLHFIGAERFGVWVTLSSLMALSALGDLGIGNGLINAISAAHGTDDRTSAHTYVSSAFFIVLAFSCVLLIVFAVLDFVISWPTLFNLSSPTAIDEVGPALKVTIALVVSYVLTGVAVKVRTGYQEVHITMFWAILGTVGGIVMLADLRRCGDPAHFYDL
jgi:O-antigen/teichoic acid export membrane protein